MLQDASTGFLRVVIGVLAISELAPLNRQI